MKDIGYGLQINPANVTRDQFRSGVAVVERFLGISSFIYDGDNKGDPAKAGERGNDKQ